MSNRRTFFSSLYKAHVYAGLFIALHVAVFSVTGLVLLFKSELTGSAPTSVEAGADPRAETVRNYSGAYQLASERYQGERPLTMYPDEDRDGIIHLRLAKGDSMKLRGARRVVYDVTTGEEVRPEEGGSGGFFDVMLRLHRELLLGGNGKLYIGFVGIVYVFMLGSGFFLYGKFMKGRRFGARRAALVPKVVDLHKFVGAATFGWALVVGITGVLLAFNGVLIKLFLAESLEHLSKQYRGAPSVQSAPFEDVVKAAVSANPDANITYVSFPDTEFGIPGHFLFLVNGSEGIAERLSDLVVVNAEAATLTEVVKLPTYLQAVLVSEPLHFGDYGGLPLKIIWALFTVCSLAVAGMGVATFVLKRRKPRPRPAGRVKDSAKPKERAGVDPHPYRFPLVLAVFCLVGMAVSLFVGGTSGQVASALLIVPLVMLFARGRSHG